MDAMAGDAVRAPRTGLVVLPEGARPASRRMPWTTCPPRPRRGAGLARDHCGLILAIRKPPRSFMAWLNVDAAGHLSPACPVVCQWAERVAEAQPDPKVSGRHPAGAGQMPRWGVRTV